MRAKNNSQAPSISRGLRWSGIVIAMTIPTLITWIYFVLAADLAGGWQQFVYLAVKVVQFAFPVVWALAVLREPLAPSPPKARGWLLGAAFSLIVVAAGWTLYAAVLANVPIFAEAAGEIRNKLADYRIDSVGRYAALAAFYSVVHSLLEEYYWRWFVFGQLRKVATFVPAAAASALCFTAHHVVVLAIYFGAASPMAWLLSAAVGVGGLFWAWLYERTGSLAGPWLSHLLIDAGIFSIGYELIRPAAA